MIRRLLAAALLPLTLVAADRAAELSRLAREAGFDPDECYRVRDLTFTKEDIRLYFTDGFLLFGKPVNGRPIAALFSADVENGDGELLVMPPNRGERMSLANFTQTPNLNEHFTTALMIFTDDSGAVLAGAVRQAAEVRKSPEMGALLASQWDGVARNLSASFEVRLVFDLLQQRPERGFFYAAVSARRVGNFDMILDPCAREQISIGQVVFRDTRAFFDNWAVFQARSYRTGRKTLPRPDFELADLRIDATIEPDLKLKARTIATLTPREAGVKALLFEMSRQMRLSEARVDGEPAETFQKESLRANVIRGGDNDLLVVVPPRELAAGRSVQIEFSHEGDVISRAGNNVYFVGSRGSWYPQRGLQFVTYDLTFRYPRDLNLVATGDIVEDRTEGDQRITRRRTLTPVRLAGFNLGRYEHVTLNRGGYRFEVCANRRIENALQPRPTPAVILPPSTPFPRLPRRPPDMVVIPDEPPAPSPTARLNVLAGEVADAFEFMSRIFGPPPLKSLTVSPIPGAFGQGFPGLVYLSTLSYLDPRERPPGARGDFQQTFFSDILHAHETAHQWWGNTVTSASYRDDWVMEALANYAALLALEKKNGPRALETVLDYYRRRLLHKDEDGKTLESAGPITWGTRLHSSLNPDAWRSIMYEKGSWIVHMLRRRMGDTQFFKMLGEVCKRYKYQALSTEEFRRIAAEFLPPRSADPQLESFFDHFVYGTGVPALKLEHSVRGKAHNYRLTGSVKQSEVPEDFAVEVPVEIHFARGKPVVEWVMTSGEPASFDVNLKQKPVRVVLDPDQAVLSRR